MERELWAELSAAISVVEREFFDNCDFVHPTSRILRVHLWAALHDRPILWATRAHNWPRELRPRALPDQSTMSRRVRSAEFEQFMQALEKRLRHLPRASVLFKRLDGKPLFVPAHSRDRQARWGWGVRQQVRGYKLHVIWAGNAMPHAWRVAPLHKSEPEMARRMLRELTGGGYIVADKNYDNNKLYDVAASRGHQLVCPRRYASAKGLGHHRHSVHRLRGLTLIDAPVPHTRTFGQHLLWQRDQIERDFGHAGNFGGGLQGLPPWVRSYRRVRLWVWAKLLINAARLRCNQRKSHMRA